MHASACFYCVMPSLFSSTLSRSIHTAANDRTSFSLKASMTIRKVIKISFLLLPQVLEAPQNPVCCLYVSARGERAGVYTASTQVDEGGNHRREPAGVFAASIQVYGGAITTGNFEHRWSANSKGWRLPCLLFGCFLLKQLVKGKPKVLSAELSIPKKPSSCTSSEGCLSLLTECTLIVTSKAQPLLLRIYT